MTSIQFHSATESNPGDDSVSGTEPFDHITPDVPDRILLVGVAVGNFVEDRLVDVTYNGVALTQLMRLSIAAGRLWVGYMVNPPVGTFAINLTWSPDPDPVFRVCAATFYNVYQADPLGQTASETSENTIPTEFATPITPDFARGLIVDFYYGQRGITGNATAPQTEFSNILGSWGSAGSHTFVASYLDHTGSEVTMEVENLTHTSSNADQFHALVELREKPVAAVLGGSII